MNECIDCGGTGEMEVDYDMPQSNSRDVGFIETRIEECEWCNGTGEIEEDE
jgi:DnaJ-class molecular chaperone